MTTIRPDSTMLGKQEWYNRERWESVIATTTKHKHKHTKHSLEYNGSTSTPPHTTGTENPIPQELTAPTP